MRHILSGITVAAGCLLMTATGPAETPREPDGALLFRQAAAAEEGSDSVASDPGESLRLLRLSAQAGYLPAQNLLGFKLMKGEGAEPDPEAGLEWIEKAAVAGDAKAANNLGYLLAQGEFGIKRDYGKAIFWLGKAADAGSPTGMAQLADLLREGKGTEPDTLSAVALYDRAIAAGLHDAELKLQEMMLPHWRKLPPDSILPIAKRYYTHGAPTLGVNLLLPLAGTLPEADALLADAYSRGAGVAYDHDRSLSLFLRAAIAGDHPSQFIVAELLEFFLDIFAFDGLPDEAHTPAYWYEKAAEGGITNGAEAYRRLLGTPEE